MLQYPTAPITSHFPSWLRATLVQVLMIFFLLCLTMLLPPLLPSSAKQPVSELQLPELLQTQPLNLTPFEQGFFADYSDSTDPATSIQKVQFEFEGISGSLLLVSSPSWRSQHAPELCYSASGYHINRSVALQFLPNVLGRWLFLDENTHSAIYWFQSSHHTTGDFLIRLWHEVTHHDPRWILVSILLNQPHHPDEPAVQKLLEFVHGALAHDLANS